MRVLFLSGWFPYPPDNGSKIRVFNLLKQLSRHHDITLLSFAQETVFAAQVGAMQSYCRSVHATPYVEFQPRRLRALFGFLSRRPRCVVDTFSSQMAAMVGEAGLVDGFDLVIASELRTALYALLLGSTPRILDDVQVTTIREQFTRQRNLVLRLRYGLTWYKTSRYVARLLSEFDACTVVSQQERSHIVRIAPANCTVAVVPNAVDLEGYEGDFGAPEPNTLIHTGALSYRANWDALNFFLKDILPLLKQERAEVTVRVTGKTEGTVLEGLPRHDRVVFTGYLDDIRPAVAQSWVSIVPLRIGGGTRLKILEAMALGTPVVATSKGAEGLEVTDGEDILIADTPAAFADAVLRLLDDLPLRSRLAANARRLVEDRYRWEDIGGRLGRLIGQVLDRRAVR